MSNTETARRTGEAAIGDKRDLIGKPLPVQSRGRRQHFTHSGAALRAFVADYDYVARLVVARLHGGECIFLTIEYARRTAVLQMFQASDFDDCTLRRETAGEADDPACRCKRII